MEEYTHITAADTELATVLLKIRTLRQLKESLIILNAEIGQKELQVNQ